MKHQETAPEVPKAVDTPPTPAEHSQVKSEGNNFVAYTNNGLVLDAEHDVEDWWNQMDVLT